MLNIERWIGGLTVFMGRPNGAGNERGEIRFSFSSVFLKKDENVVENVSEELSLGFLHEFCLCVCGLEMRIVSLNWIFRVFITGSARVVWNLD